jgi:hypothetical protein
MIKKTQEISFKDKIKLLFCKKRTFTDDLELYVITYKQFKNGKIFILSTLRIPPKHVNCRCTLRNIK